MKILKLASALMILIGSASVYGTPSEEPTVHTPYISYDANQYGPGTPSIGYRYQKDDIILDANIGYKYLLGIGDVHFGTASANIFYSFWENEKSQIYSGIGCTVNFVKGKDYFFYDDVNGKYCFEKCAVHNFTLTPSISIGQDINFGESKKIFIELYYRPWSFGNGYSGRLHMTGIKIGVGI